MRALPRINKWSLEEVGPQKEGRKERRNYIQDQPLRLKMGKGPIKIGPNSNTRR
jgi:hypothetical protein